MSILIRYILRQLSVGVFFVTLALVGILWLSQSLRLIELIVGKGISAWLFLRMTLLLLPGFVSVILPIAAFTVMMFVYHRLNGDRELVVLQAAGLSNARIARPGLILGGGLTALCLLLSLWITPISTLAFRNLQWDAARNLGSILLQEGVFNKFGTNLTVYLRGRDGDGQLFGILIHDRREPFKPSTMTAERGAQIMTDNQRRIVLFNGSRQQVDLRTGQFSVLRFDSYTLDLDDGKDRSGDEPARDLREREMSSLALLTLTRDQADPVLYSRAKVELMQRVSSPFLNMAFCVIALASLLSARFNRRSQLKPFLAAVPLVVLIQAAVLGLSSLSLSNMSFLPLIPVVILMPTGVGLWYLVAPWSFRPSQKTVRRHVSHGKNDLSPQESSGS